MPDPCPLKVGSWPLPVAGLAAFAEREIWNVGPGADYSALMLAARTTLAHFSVSSAMNLPNSAGEVWNTVLPRSANRAFITGLASAALISMLSLLMISAGVFRGAPMPKKVLAS